MSKKLKLDPQKIIETLELLEKRISERFPDNHRARIEQALVKSMRRLIAVIRFSNHQAKSRRL